VTLKRTAAAGVLGGLALALAQAVLRFAGIPLPSELVADRVLPLLPVQAFIFVVGHLGGPLEAKRMALVGGFLGSVAAGALAGAIYALLMRRPWPARHPNLTLAIGVLLLWLAGLALLGPVLQASHVGLPPLPAAIASALGLLAQFLLYALVLNGALTLITQTTDQADSGRRGLLLAGAGLVVALATGSLATVLYRRSTLGYDGMSLPGPVDRITPPDRFYVVTKNLIDPQVDSALWRLEVTGKVERPATYSLDQLTSLPGAIEQETTLECISNEVGRGLMSNAVWRGVRLRDLIQSAGPSPYAVGVSFRAVDAYTHTASMKAALDEATLVVWLMNGRPLPDHHGYPARLLVPSAYGEVSVKWLTRIELVDHTEKGYYESQGWQPTYVETTSRIDVPGDGEVVRSGTRLRMRGIGYAAERGISRVEVTTDGGSTWRSATIESGAPRTWSLWSLDWTPAGSGVRTLKVRAYDGTGRLQTLKYRPSVPAGVTGEHTIRVTVTP
jgi:DMSO/TMAO reductase YedYZ molybdopterin-dependent catalytic subunit